LLVHSAEFVTRKNFRDAEYGVDGVKNHIRGRLLGKRKSSGTRINNSRPMRVQTKYYEALCRKKMVRNKYISTKQSKEKE
jgi:hypothetical protein